MRDDSVSPEAHGEAFEDHGAHVRQKPDGALDPAGEAGWYLRPDKVVEY